jgi:fructose-1,6-bisphosphatase
MMRVHKPRHALTHGPLALNNSGAMVPDVHHMISKGGGLFLSPGSAAAPPKLRLLFEACPMAYVVEAAGGASSDADGLQSLLVRDSMRMASSHEKR